MRIRKGDKVKVISGKYKGRNGTIKQIFTKSNKVTVEKINMKIKHIKPKQSEEKGYLKNIEGTIDYSNIRKL